jgi:hypothetical protein
MRECSGFPMFQLRLFSPCLSVSVVNQPSDAYDHFSSQCPSRKFPLLAASRS